MNYVVTEYGYKLYQAAKQDENGNYIWFGKVGEKEEIEKLVKELNKIKK